MKKLRKLKDGGAVGNGVGSIAAGGSAIGGTASGRLLKRLQTDILHGSIRPWIHARTRSLQKVDLKRHEIQYMDLTPRETQLIKPQPEQNKHVEFPSEEFTGDYSVPENESFLGGEMTADDSNGGIEVKPKPKPLVTEKLIMGVLVGLGVSLLILLLF